MKLGLTAPPPKKKEKESHPTHPIHCAEFFSLSNQNGAEICLHYISTALPDFPSKQNKILSKRKFLGHLTKNSVWVSELCMGLTQLDPSILILNETSYFIISLLNSLLVYFCTENIFKPLDTWNIR